MRKKISGTAERPRMAVFVSNRGINVQLIDDENCVTVASASSRSGKNVAAAKELGRAAAESALAKGVKTVVIDRGGFKYHGRVKAVVETALETGLSVGQQGASEPAPVAEASAEEDVKEDT